MLAYQRVYKQILQALKDNTYPIGSLLPAEPELEKIYGVSRTTVRRAIAQLAEEGYVKVKQGHGTIVLKSIYPTDAFEYSRLHHFEDILSIRHVNIPNPEQMSARGMYIDSVASDETISQVLEIPVGTMVYRIQRIFYSGDNPLMFLNNYLRMDFFPNLDRWTEQFWDLYPFLVQHYNIQYQGCSEYISAVSADLVDAQILHINPGVPLLNSRRIARCNLGPLEYAVLRIRTDVMELCITMGPNLESNSLNYSNFQNYSAYPQKRNQPEQSETVTAWKAF